MKTLYTLRLKQGKYYVGTTRNFELRLDQHQTGRGAEWTKKYKVIGVLNKEEVSSKYSAAEETKQTFRIMLKYGLNNVRGGEYCQLRDYTINEIAFAMAHHLRMDWKEVIRQLNTPTKLLIDENRLKEKQKLRNEARRQQEKEERVRASQKLRDSKIKMAIFTEQFYTEYELFCKNQNLLEPYPRLPHHRPQLLTFQYAKKENEESEFTINTLEEYFKLNLRGYGCCTVSRIEYLHRHPMIQSKLVDGKCEQLIKYFQTHALPVPLDFHKVPLPKHIGIDGFCGYIDSINDTYVYSIECLHFVLGWHSLHSFGLQFKKSWGVEYTFYNHGAKTMLKESTIGDSSTIDLSDEDPDIATMKKECFALRFYFEPI